MEFTTGDSTGDDAEVLCLVFIVVRSTEMEKATREQGVIKGGPKIQANVLKLAEKRPLRGVVIRQGSCHT